MHITYIYIYICVCVCNIYSYFEGLIMKNGALKPLHTWFLIPLRLPPEAV